jgi:hypothetical protein
MSVSDVIVLQWRGEVSSHFVDSVGFKELPSFTGNEREQADFSQLGKSSDAPTVADLEADVKAGKSISLMDLSKAVNNERSQTMSKAKPSLHDRLEAGKQRAAQQGKLPAAPSVDTQKTNNHREV